MTVAVVCASHVPLALCDETPAPQKAQFLDCMRSVGEWIREFDPEFIIEFGPDHFNGFFYDAMPNFCIGLSAYSVGDWKTSRGPLSVPREIALEACAAVRKAGIDLDLAQEMKVDHGFTQIIELMLGSIEAYPLIPVMLNCAAPPLPAFRRVRLLGEALGAFARDTRRRVLIVGSGGLSHDPPIPQFDSVDEGQQKLMVNGRNPNADIRKQRERRVVTAAIDFYAGRNKCRPPDPLWDNEFISILQSGNMSDADEWVDESVTATAGCGGHEVRTWIAAFSALKGAGADGYKTTVEYYQAIPQWMTGVGIVRAQ